MPSSGGMRVHDLSKGALGAFLTLRRVFQRAGTTESQPKEAALRFRDALAAVRPAHGVVPALKGWQKEGSPTERALASHLLGCLTRHGGLGFVERAKTIGVSRHDREAGLRALLVPRSEPTGFELNVIANNGTGRLQRGTFLLDATGLTGAREEAEHLMRTLARALELSPEQYAKSPILHTHQ